MLLCGWRLQKNLAAKFKSLSHKDHALYSKVLNLPFVTCSQKFDAILQEIRQSEDVTENEEDYLKEKLKEKQKWAKSATKSQFSGGVCVTSRIEGLHGVLKRHLNATSSLNKLFNCFRQLEKMQIKKFEEEFKRHSRQAENFDANPLKEIKQKYSEYIYKKICPKFSKSLNYILEPNGRSTVSW